MAHIVINQKEMMQSNSLGICMLIEMLQPRNAMDVCHPTSLADSNDLVASDALIAVLNAVMSLACKNYIVEYHCSHHINALY